MNKINFTPQGKLWIAYRDETLTSKTVTGTGRTIKKAQKDLEETEMFIRISKKK